MDDDAVLVSLGVASALVDANSADEGQRTVQAWREDLETPDVVSRCWNNDPFAKEISLITTSGAYPASQTEL